MYLLLFVVALWVSSVRSGQTPDDDTITVARCRVSCLDQFPSTVGGCHGDDCSLCWDLCELLVVDSYSWSILCTTDQRHRCSRGCRSACDVIFTENPTTMMAESHVTWQFTGQTKVKTTSQTTSRITWVEPRPHHRHHGDKKHNFVYVIYEKVSEDTTWSSVAITDGHYADVVTSDSIQWRLVAVTSSGVVAECFPGQYATYLSLSDDTESVVSPHQITQPIITTEIIDGVLQASVTLIFPFNIISDNIVVQWERIWYDSGPSGINITLPDQLLTRSINTFQDTQGVLLPGVTYNSDYRLNVYATSTMTPLQIVYFYTQMCTSPDPTYTVCSDVTETLPAPASVDPRDFRMHFRAAVGACVFLTVVAVMMCVTLVCHHARSRHYMKHVIKSMRRADNNNVIPTHVTSTHQSFINFRGELDSGISLGDNGHSFV